MGHINIEDARAYARKWRAQNLDKSRAYSRKWKANNKDQVRAYGRKYSKTPYHKAYARQYKKRRAVLDRLLARNAVYAAIKRGVLKRGKCCFRCKKRSRTQGHHYLGYAPKHRLDVVWLCHACHVETH